MAKKTKDTDYLALSAWIHVLENRLLTRERRERLLDARETGDMARVLTECGYGELTDFSPAGLDALLEKEQEALYAELAHRLPRPSVLAVFQIPTDYHNAKALIKSEATGAPAQSLLLPGGRYETKGLSEAFARGDLGAYSPAFREAVAGARALLASSRDPQQADFLLDAAAFAEERAAAEESGSGFLRDYVALRVDTANLRTLVRARRNGQEGDAIRRALLPGGTVDPEAVEAGGEEAMRRLYRDTPLREAAELGAELLSPGAGDMTAFERACDNALAAFVRPARRVPFGVEPVVGYLYARRADMTALRVILTGKMADVPRDTIRERLREAYG